MMINGLRSCLKLTRPATHLKRWFFDVYSNGSQNLIEIWFKVPREDTEKYCLGIVLQFVVNWSCCWFLDCFRCLGSCFATHFQRLIKTIHKSARCGVGQESIPSLSCTHAYTKIELGTVRLLISPTPQQRSSWFPLCWLLHAQSWRVASRFEKRTSLFYAYKIL